MNRTNQYAGLKLPNFEITPETLVLHFHEKSTVIPLSEIRSYDVEWQLHEPLLGKKWWSLNLTVRLNSGEEKAGQIAFVNFSYLGSDRQTCWNIETQITDAIDAALSSVRAWPNEIEYLTGNFAPVAAGSVAVKSR